MAIFKVSKLSLIAVIGAVLFLITMYVLFQHGSRNRDLEIDTIKNSRLLPMRSFDGRYLPSLYQQSEVGTSVTQQTLPMIENCYREWKGNYPKFKSGRLKVSWEINPDGHVGKADILGAGIAGLNECVVKSVLITTFPPPPSDKPVIIEHFFEFPLNK